MSQHVLTLVFLLLTALNLATTSQTDAAVKIVDQGKTQALIVTSPTPTRAVKLAARELQTYLEKISGAKLAIATAPSKDASVNIFVGPSESTQSHGITDQGLDDGAYRIISGDNWLVLIGQDKDFVPPEPWARSRGDWLQTREAQWDKITGEHWVSPLGQTMYKFYNKELDIWDYDQRGSLNAVYGYIRSLGVHWYMPGDLGEILPEHKTIALEKIDKTVKPDMPHRKMNFPRFGLSDLDSILWALRLGNNAYFIDMHHGMRNLTDRKEQRKNHSEYYVLINGKRDTESKTANTCLSSKAFFDATVRYVCTMADVYGVNDVSVMPHDGFSVICQCEDCQSKATLDRGSSGWYSDYVWGFVNSVAKEVAKTHPDMRINCGAYSTYRLPPLKIKHLEPNVYIRMTNGRPVTSMEDKSFEDLAELRKQWREKTDNPIQISLNYPFTQRGTYQPQYFPHVIARGIHETKGQVWSEDVWLPEKRGLYQPGMNHLNAYVIAACWWDADLNIDALLDTYCKDFYGPAAAQMKAFIEYSEANYAELVKDADIVNKDIALFDAAKAAVKPDTVYGQRIAMVDDFLKTLRSRSAQLGKKRENVPEFKYVIDVAKDKWRDIRDTLVMDGKIDEPFWTAYPSGAGLRDMITGAKPAFATTFLGRWKDGNLYLAIKCADVHGRKPISGSDKSGDPAIWSGDKVEILIETDDHAYYQIVVNPAGAVMDLDRGVSKEGWYSWRSQAEVATHVSNDGWSVEIRLPVAANSTDPLHNIVGKQPSERLPWFFNICRVRFDDEGKAVEKTMYSPTGEKNFHVTGKFGKLMVR